MLQSGTACLTNYSISNVEPAAATGRRGDGKPTRQRGAEFMAVILVVDDMRSMRDLVKAVLAKQGHEVVTREDGEQALAFARSDRADLVITDINMPNMGGVELVTALRKLTDYAATPILMLTTETTGDKKQAARDAGANGWIQKPFEPERLVAAVETTLAKL